MKRIECECAGDNDGFFEFTPEVGVSDNSELLAAAGKACIDIYTDLHVSEMRHKPEHLKQAWSIGQELYLKKIGS